MAAKIIAQLVIQGFSILTRATFTAYQQALKNAKNGGAASTATAVIRRKMDVGEAYQVLNLERSVVDKAEIEEVYQKFFKANDPKDGGSFYLQSKIFRAKEAILRDALDATKDQTQDQDKPPPT
mmetsp:Transcript_4005/g.6802  ORF Transcript_4005/g.6802 Transcript_4005/m.6802 type:complete len:124 (-) Transcript_4005:305-676(-)